MSRKHKKLKPIVIEFHWTMFDKAKKWRTWKRYTTKLVAKEALKRMNRKYKGILTARIRKNVP